MTGLTWLTVVMAVLIVIVVAAVASSQVADLVAGLPWWATPLALVWGGLLVRERYGRLLKGLFSAVAAIHSEEQSGEPAILHCSDCRVVYPSRYYFAVFGRRERVCDSCQKVRLQQQPQQRSEGACEDMDATRNPAPLGVKAGVQAANGTGP